LSSRLTAEVQRDGVHWVQEYARGVALTPPIAAGPARGNATTITFQPDAEIFTTTEFSYDVLERYFRELAFLNRGLDIALTDERTPGRLRSQRFRFPGGVRDFVIFLDEEAAAGAGVPGTSIEQDDVIGFERADPRMAGTVDVALRWYGSHEERLRSFANSWPTPEGGTHEAGFREGLAAAVNAYARKRGLLTEEDPDLSTDRIGEGLTAVVSVKLERLEFQGATRGRLGGTVVHYCVTAAVREHLGTWFEEQPERARAVIGRILS
jgi:DNA gyrase subunit B